MSEQAPETPPEVPTPRKAARKPRTTGTTDTPRSSSSQPRPEPPRERTREDAKLAESVKSMYEGVGMLALMVGLQREEGNPFLVFAGQLMEPAMEVGPDGTVTSTGRTGADRLSDAWMSVADRNARVKAALKRFTEGGAFAELIALHIPLVLPFAPAVSAALPGFLGTRRDPDSNGNGATSPII